jgi:hypothetical protein
MTTIGTSFPVPTALLCRRPSSWPALFGNCADGPGKKPSAQVLAIGTLTVSCSEGKINIFMAMLVI